MDEVMWTYIGSAETLYACVLKPAGRPAVYDQPGIWRLLAVLAANPACILHSSFPQPVIAMRSCPVLRDTDHTAISSPTESKNTVLASKVKKKPIVFSQFFTLFVLRLLPGLKQTL
jgi:hypothetical protein